MELSLLKILNRHCIRSSSQVQKNNCSSTRRGRGNLATDNEKFPVGIWTVLEPRMSQHSRCGFPDALGLYSCQIPSISIKGPEGPVFICLTCAYTRSVLQSGSNHWSPWALQAQWGEGWAMSQENREGSYIIQGTWLSFPKLWRAMMRKNGKTWPVQSKRANLELRSKKESKKEREEPK